MIELLQCRDSPTPSISRRRCKQAHWNVKGPNFIALHKLFDEINEDVEEYVDLTPSGWSSSVASPRAPRGSR